MSKPFLLLVLLLTCLPLSLDAEAPAAPKVVVLELRPENKAIALDSAVVVTDIVRTRLVIDAGSALRVLSKEKVFEILQQSGKSAASCTADCQIQTAREVGADGVHLPAAQLMAASARPDLPLVAASCHDARELAQAASLGLDFVVLGPVKETRSHPGQPNMGWNSFARLIEDYPLPVYALGGLTATDREAAWQAGAHGIAAIRAAWE